MDYELNGKFEMGNVEWAMKDRQLSSVTYYKDRKRITNKEH